MHKHLAAFAVTIALSGATAWATDYSVETFDFPGSPSTSVTGINASGRIIGNYQIPNTTVGVHGGFGFTERNGTYTSIGDSTLCRPSGRCEVSLLFLNELGQFAGVFSADVDFPGAFTQTVNGPRVFVQPPGFPNAAVLGLAGLNNFGKVAGCHSTPDIQQASFIQFGSDFKTVSLPFPDGSLVCASGLNDLGQLTGTVTTGLVGSTTHGFISIGNHVRLFDIPAGWNYDGQSIKPVQISDLGVVIGTYRDTAGNTHGFVVNGSSVEKVDFPGVPTTRPVGINILGDIVGNYEIPTTSGFITQPFILRAGAYSTVTLPVFGTPVVVAGIDNFGRLFGDYAGHGFVATPKAN